MLFYTVAALLGIFGVVNAVTNGDGKFLGAFMFLLLGALFPNVSAFSIGTPPPTPPFTPERRADLAHKRRRLYLTILLVFISVLTILISLIVVTS